MSLAMMAFCSRDPPLERAQEELERYRNNLIQYRDFLDRRIETEGARAEDIAARDKLYELFPGLRPPKVVR
ncbi:MAG: hypothetical protein AABX50_00600 [Nanoarchaeota archaeon]